MSVYTTVNTVTFETALQAVQLTVEEAQKVGVVACATVVDPSLQLVAYGRADGMTPHSVETSRRKAQTAASTRKPSAAILPELATKLELGSGGLLTSVAGGVPLVFDGVHVGGLGVAGGKPVEDAQIAAAVLERLGADSV